MLTAEVEQVLSSKHREVVIASTCPPSAKCVTQAPELHISHKFGYVDEVRSHGAAYSPTHVRGGVTLEPELVGFTILGKKFSVSGQITSSMSLPTSSMIDRVDDWKTGAVGVPAMMICRCAMNAMMTLIRRLAGSQDRCYTVSCPSFGPPPNHLAFY